MHGCLLSSARAHCTLLGLRVLRFEPGSPATVNITLGVSCTYPRRSQRISNEKEEVTSNPKDRNPKPKILSLQPKATHLLLLGEPW